jgi:glycosyltransferase involved in cell wall biosynthesis
LKLNPSVVIPTYNRKEVLVKALEAYKSQTTAGEILEDIVVDDGSNDGTEQAVAQASASSPFPIRYLRQERQGPAAARNLGIYSANGELILFSDDDIIPSPRLVAEHVAWHRRYSTPSVGVLGHVAWSPEVHPTPFMQWLGLDGPLFRFARLSPGCDVGFLYCYSGNISVKTSFLVAHGMFDEDFGNLYGYEDLELAYRLMKKGFRLLYNPDAIGHHYKRMTFADACRRAEMAEVTYEFFKTKVPAEARGDASTVRNALRRLVRLFAPALAPFAFILDTQIPLPWWFYRGFYTSVVSWITARRRRPER